MPYTESDSRKQFEVASNGFSSLMSTLTSPSVTPDLRAHAIASAIFLAHASFEVYFTDVLDRLAEAYNAASDISLIPVRLRAHIFLARSNLALAVAARAAGGAEHELLDRTNIFSNAAGAVVNPALGYHKITGSQIYGELSYPSKKNVERVLKRLGVLSPLNALNAIFGMDVISLLQSISGLRTSLAHSGTLPGISAGDVVMRIQGLQKFVEAFDRLLYQQVCASHGDAQWQTTFP